jgi:FKBP-type peptidyl-prolyl cis-trans isomerase
MKTTINLGAGIFALALGASIAAARTNGPAAPAAPPAFTDRQIIETWGWIVARQEGMAGMEISESELASWLKGFSSGVHGQASPGGFAVALPDLERLRQARRAKLVRAIEKENEAEAKSFFAALKKNTNVIRLPGGLGCEILKPGNGPFPQSQQTVNVHFTGRLLDGTEFCQFGPSDMILVTNHAPFPAWVDGVRRINQGGAIKLYVPPPLHETEALAAGIPPGSARIFEVELFDIRDTDAQSLADALVPPAPEAELPASGLAAAQLFETWGWSIAQRTRAARFKLAEKELAALADGMALGIKGKPCRYDLPAIVPAVEEFVNHHLDRARLAFRQKQLADMENLFAELKKNTNVVAQTNGLRYEILVPGSGPHPKPGEFVKVNYVGRLIDGRVFDRTDPALGPLDIQVGKVFPGWNEGVQKIGNGGRIKLYIPPALGCGEDTSGGVPPFSTLIYDIELLGIRDTLETEPPPAKDK